MKTERGGFRMLRHEQVMTGPFDDGYRLDYKLPEPTRCPDCGANFVKGRWTWKKTTGDAHVYRCPACQRVHDRFPAGYVTLKGRFTPERRAELLALVKARDARAREEHPLQRIIAVEDVADGIQVSTTDGHLARAIGRALHDAFHGTLELTYSRDENLVRAIWRPETGKTR
jgi:NMD protein affecting ribosome stability and mRNA decay